jgi:hypothetical protein
MVSDVTDSVTLLFNSIGQINPIDQFLLADCDDLIDMRNGHARLGQGLSGV